MLHNSNSENMGVGQFWEQIGDKGASAIMDHGSHSTFIVRHFCRRQYRSNFNSVDVTNWSRFPEAAKFGKITQNNGHLAVRGHSRSPISVPVETPYVTSY